MTRATGSATAIVSQVRGATRSPSSRKPSSPATNGPVLMRISVLATDVRDSAKMKHVEAVAMHTAAIRTGPPPSRHWATMLRRLAAPNTPAPEKGAHEHPPAAARQRPHGLDD